MLTMFNVILILERGSNVLILPSRERTRVSSNLTERNEAADILYIKTFNE